MPKGGNLLSSDSRATVYELLEWPQICTLLANEAESEIGREYALQLRPNNELQTCLDLLDETEQALAVLSEFEPPRLNTVWRSDTELQHLRKRGALDGLALLRFARLIETSWRMKQFALKIAHLNCTHLYSLLADIEDCTDVMKKIYASIDKDGEILDSASERLAEIRTSIVHEEKKLREVLEQITRDPNIQPYLQEPIVTLRRDRYVLPVRQEMRDHVRGVVHDMSASGATVFIEPLAVVERQNKLRQLRWEQTNEEKRILHELSEQLRVYSEELAVIVDRLGQIDFQLAKARLARRLGAVRPTLSTTKTVYLPGARHPLLGKDAVPLDIDMGDARVMVITGPNTGGKTVTLKTIGLLAMMAQAGLFITAEAGATLPVFHTIHADLGDEQNLKQSLSTFSSHMTRIVAMVRNLHERDLVLLDEVGAGTDPDEGAALASALLQYFMEQQAIVIATTHYSELKAMAAATPGMVNASMEFDERTLRPTYRLRIGVPGSSNAFVIARRLGLPAKIVRDAEANLRSESQATNELLEQLRRREHDLQEASKYVELLEDEWRRKLEELEQRREKLVSKEQRILDEARQRARALLEDMKRERKAMAERRRQQLPNVGEWKRKMEESLSPRAAAMTPNTRTIQTEEVQPGWRPKQGETVWVEHIGQEGEVTSVSRGGEEYTVRIGFMTLSATLDQLRPITKKRAGQRTQREGAMRPDHVRLQLERSKTFQPEISLRMLTVAEGIEKLDKFLDDAILAGVDEVRIIHGKGSGAMRQAVHEYLRQTKYVKEFRLGGRGEGDLGVTIAILESF